LPKPAFLLGCLRKLFTPPNLSLQKSFGTSSFKDTLLCSHFNLLAD